MLFGNTTSTYWITYGVHWAWGRRKRKRIREREREQKAKWDTKWPKRGQRRRHLYVVSDARSWFFSKPTSRHHTINQWPTKTTMTKKEKKMLTYLLTWITEALECYDEADEMEPSNFHHSRHDNDWGSATDMCAGRWCRRVSRRRHRSRKPPTTCSPLVILSCYHHNPRARIIPHVYRDKHYVRLKQEICFYDLTCSVRDSNL